MNVSYNWLKKHVDLEGLTPEEVANKLTFAGAEVEDIHYLAQGDHLVIGKILSCVPHPESDHLHILQVDEGPVYGVHQIVCGAPNAREGLKVIVATDGAKLPGGEIKPTLLRGVESDGMCCALYELGVDKKYLSEKQCAGIEELSEDAPIGETDVLGYLGLDDAVLELSVLPNRPDLYALNNVAKEVSCLLSRPLIEEKREKVKTVKKEFPVSSITPNCPAFSARLVKGVVTKPSPRWLASFLQAEGIRSINNVVDIGNYVMLLTGQPLNMYDADKLPKDELEVRDDLDEDYLAMDGNTYRLIPGDLVVCSDRRPMCLAGIMTADACRVDEHSRNIVIESANFAYACIRHTSNRLGLSSDSSLRFCKGINPDQNEEVQELASSLLVELADAEEVGETNLYDTLAHAPKKIEVSLDYINRRLGTSFSLEEVVGALKRDFMGIEIQGVTLLVSVPSHRIDMDGAADVSEEVIRILGYENVPSVLPVSSIQAKGLTLEQSKERLIKNYLLSNGVSEVLTYTLLSKKENEAFAYLTVGEPYVLTNPMTEQRGEVRKNLLHSVLLAANYNASRQNKDLAFFEISDIDAIGLATKRLALVLAGEKKEQGGLKKRPYGFYDLKGYLEGILSLLGLGPNRYQILPWSKGGSEFHPYRSAELKVAGKTVGVFGELHPNALKEYGLKSAAAMELDLKALLEQKTSAPKASIPSKYPSITRDLAFTLDRTISYGDIEKELKRCDSLIKEVEIFDVYEGIGILPGKKSVAISLVLSSDEKTLKDEEVNAVIEKAILVLRSRFGAEVRG